MMQKLLILALAGFVFAARASAADRCEASCPRGAIPEGEPCGASVNNVCTSAVPFSCGQTMCGASWADNGMRDRDWFQFAVGEQSTVTITGAAALPMGLHVGQCDSLPSVATLAFHTACGPFEGTVCLAPGEWWILMTPPSATTRFPCGTSNDYWFSVTCVADGCTNFECGDPAAGSCYAAHRTASCELKECCEIVCAVAPMCCDVIWDAICAGTAPEFCSDPPLNDVCAGATVIAEGETLFSTYAALPGPALPAPCSEGGGTSTPTDIWFAWTATRSGLASVSSCSESSGATRIAVHEGECASHRLVGCVDDPDGCSGSEAAFLALCGETYLIQLSTEFWAWESTLTLDALGAACCGACTGDVNDDATVDAADLAIVLGNWSSAGACSDLNGSGLVDAADLGVLLGAWGSCQ